VPSGKLQQGNVYQWTWTAPDGTELGPEDQLQVQWPVSREVPDIEGTNILFEASRTYQGMGVSLGFLLLQVGYPEQSFKPRQYADAVSVAALQAAASGSRRAVVLVLGKSDREESTLDRASVRRFLARLRVPFYVWSLAGAQPGVPAAAWGAFEDISHVQAFRLAVDRLRRDLDSQSIVWVEGRHLPQDIALSDDAAGIELAR